MAREFPWKRSKSARQTVSSFSLASSKRSHRVWSDMLPKVRALDEGAGTVGVWMGSRSVAVGQSDQSRCSSDEGRAEFEARLRGEAKRIETSLFFFSRGRPSSTMVTVDAYSDELTFPRIQYVNVIKYVSTLPLITCSDACKLFAICKIYSLIRFS